jgi:low affinity Fe/Cu permease
MVIIHGAPPVLAGGRNIMRRAKSRLKNHSSFNRFAKWTAHMSGKPATFVLAVGVIAAWAITGPIFHFSDTWQLIINTGTTIVTFLMVFLIQNTQNRDSEALQLKLDELIRAVEGAQDSLLDLEEMEDEELDRIRANYERLAQRARAKLRHRKTADHAASDTAN